MKTATRKPAWEDLQGTFLDRLPDAAPEDPAPERIWEAALGRLSPQETRAILDRVVADPACARVWQAAKAIVDHEREAGRAEKRRAPRIWWAAAAGILIAITGTMAWRAARDPAGDAYRGGAGIIAELPRSGPRLAWEGPPAARRYGVRILGRDLEVLLVSEDLSEPGFTIPPDVLAGIGEDGFLWQVEAVLEDGTRVLSETFEAKAEGRGSAP